MKKNLTLFSVLVPVYILVCWEMTQDPGDLAALLCWMEEILESLNLRSLTSSSLVLPWVWFLHCGKLSFQLLTVSPDVNCWAHLVDGISTSCYKYSNVMRQTGKTQTSIYNIYCTVRKQITVCSSQYWLYNLCATYFQTLKYWAIFESINVVINCFNWLDWEMREVINLQHFFFNPTVVLFTDKYLQ